ncbi:MAG: zinc ribbon domain-containing protein [Lachnospiraceae bacterium]|nr:zinc ribbon domain-containing protein [Lachnospiraceae bacterium]
MFCNQCGTQLPDGSKFCNACGAKQRIHENENTENQISYEQAEQQIQPDTSYYSDDYSLDNTSGDYNSVNNNDKMKINERQNSGAKKGIIIGEIIGTIVAAVVIVIFVLNPFSKKSQDDSNDKALENNNKTEVATTDRDDVTTVATTTEDKQEVEKETKEEVYSSTTYIYNVAVNTSSGDNFTNLSEISRSTTRYYHFQIGGLSSGEKIPLSYRITGTDGYTSFGVFDTDRGSDDYLWISFGYDDASNVKKGTETVKVYRDDTHELIGKMSVEIRY